MIIHIFTIYICTFELLYFIFQNMFMLLSVLSSRGAAVALALFRASYRPSGADSAIREAADEALARALAQVQLEAKIWSEIHEAE